MQSSACRPADFSESSSEARGRLELALLLDLLVASLVLGFGAAVVLALELRLELYVLGHDRDLRPSLPHGARPPVLLQPADHPLPLALLEDSLQTSARRDQG
jgi:hypothetical protein